MFSDYVVKHSHWGIKQERILVLTSRYVYNFKKKHLKRKIPVPRIGGLIFSLKHKNDVVIHIPSEYDYRYSLDRLKEFIILLKQRFQMVAPNSLLKIFLVPASLKEFTTTEKDMKYKPSRVPTSKYRQRDQEVGTEEKKYGFNSSVPPPDEEWKDQNVRSRAERPQSAPVRNDEKRTDLEPVEAFKSEPLE